MKIMKTRIAKKRKHPEASEHSNNENCGVQILENRQSAGSTRPSRKSILGRTFSYVISIILKSTTSSTYKRHKIHEAATPSPRSVSDMNNNAVSHVVNGNKKIGDDSCCRDEQQSSEEVGGGGTTEQNGSSVERNDGEIIAEKSTSNESKVLQSRPTKIIESKNANNVSNKGDNETSSILIVENIESNKSDSPLDVSTSSKVSMTITSTGKKCSSPFEKGHGSLSKEKKVTTTPHVSKLSNNANPFTTDGRGSETMTSLFVKTSQNRSNRNIETVQNDNLTKASLTCFRKPQATKMLCNTPSTSDCSESFHQKSSMEYERSDDPQGEQQPPLPPLPPLPSSSSSITQLPLHESLTNSLSIAPMPQILLENKPTMQQHYPPTTPYHPNKCSSLPYSVIMRSQHCDEKYNNNIPHSYHFPNVKKKDSSLIFGINDIITQEIDSPMHPICIPYCYGPLPPYFIDQIQIKNVDDNQRKVYKDNNPKKKIKLATKHDEKRNENNTPTVTKPVAASSTTFSKSLPFINIPSQMMDVIISNSTAMDTKSSLVSVPITSPLYAFVDENESCIFQWINQYTTNDHLKRIFNEQCRRKRNKIPPLVLHELVENDDFRRSIDCDNFTTNTGTDTKILKNLSNKGTDESSFVLQLNTRKKMKLALINDLAREALKQTSLIPEQVNVDFTSIDTYHFPNYTKEPSLETLLEMTYSVLHNFLPEGECESLAAMKVAHTYYQYFKPEKVKILIMAESHAFTSEETVTSGPIMNKEFLNKYDYDGPTELVSLVHCLGYGEKDILVKRQDGLSLKSSNEIPNEARKGTPQFWRLFGACVSGLQGGEQTNIHQNVNDEKESTVVQKKKFGSELLKGTTKNLHQRIEKKMGILHRLKELGIWLIDLSPLALYVPQETEYNISSSSPHTVYKLPKKIPREEMKKHILILCWELFTKHVVRKVVGEGHLRMFVPIGRDVQKHVGMKRFGQVIDTDEVEILTKDMKAPNAMSTNDWTYDKMLCTLNVHVVNTLTKERIHHKVETLPPLMKNTAEE